MYPIFNKPSIEHRIFGLDFLRAIAILLVVFGHSLILVPATGKVLMHMLILDGVSIFFVLSGFLIGGILIRLVEKNTFTTHLLWDFWKKRWLRTLPLYYIILLILILITWQFQPSLLPNDLWKYFLFLQNFNVEQPHFFSESWSLCVEEWFYILIPIALFLFIRFTKLSDKSAVLWVICLTSVIVTTNRWFDFDAATIDSYSDGIHFLMRVTTRLDAIVYGVFGAFLAHYYPFVWNFFAKWWFVVVGFLGLYLLKFSLNEDASVFNPILKSFCIVVMLPFLAQWRTRKNSITKAFTFISLISYSMYLVNLNLVMFIGIKKIYHANLAGKHVPDELWWVDYGIFWGATILIAYQTYRWIEVPFMNARK